MIYINIKFFSWLSWAVKDQAQLLVLLGVILRLTTSVQHWPCPIVCTMEAPPEVLRRLVTTGCYASSMESYLGPIKMVGFRRETQLQHQTSQPVDPMDFVVKIALQKCAVTGIAGYQSVNAPNVTITFFLHLLTEVLRWTILCLWLIYTCWKITDMVLLVVINFAVDGSNIPVIFSIENWNCA